MDFPTKAATDLLAVLRGGEASTNKILFDVIAIMEWGARVIVPLFLTDRAQPVPPSSPTIPGPREDDGKLGGPVDLSKRVAATHETNEHLADDLETLVLAHTQGDPERVQASAAQVLPGLAEVQRRLITVAAAESLADPNQGVA